MSDIIFANNASALLNTTISDSDTTIELATGFGAAFPSPSGTQFFFATLENDQGDFEIVRCTSRTGDLLTVVRGQDNTTAQGFTQNVTRVELRLTAALMSSFVQVTGAVMTGNLDMGGNSLENAVIIDATITGGQVVAPLRGAAGVSSNEIAVPTSGRATVGGVEILASGDDIVAQLDTGGVIILDSATIGVRIPAGAYFRLEGSTTGQQFSTSHDDTDLNSLFVGTTDWNISGLTGNIVFGVNGLDMAENDLLRPNIADFQIQAQTVSASTTTSIDYRSGSYVTLNMDQNITNLNISNPPLTQFATVRLKIVQDGTGGRTITNWPGADQWPGGSPPTLSTGANAVDFVDLWTDDGGTTWYGAFANDWS